jgi:alginate O-acetyltransferase complex protein AlgJ
VNRRHPIAALILVLAACGGHKQNAPPAADFRAACKAMAEQTINGSEKLVEGRDGWIFVTSELLYVAAGGYIGEAALSANPDAPPQFADPIPAIVDFNAQLQQRGIDLFFVPIPVRPAIYPEGILGADRLADLDTVPNFDCHLQELLSELRERGVRVVDLGPRFRNRREHAEHGSVFCPSSTHWTPYGALLASRTLAKEITARPWYEAVPKYEFRQRWITKEYSGGVYKAFERATGKNLEPDLISRRRILLRTPSGNQRLDLRYPDSPVIVMGDSNTVWWKNSQSALPQQLAFDLGFPVDVLSTQGGGANETRLNLARLVRAEPGYLEGKRAVIWCFSARAFTGTEEGWIPIPL